MPSILKHVPPSKPPFTPIPVNTKKSSKCYTQSYYILASILTPHQERLLRYIIAKARNTNYINISTQLLKDFSALNKKLERKVITEKSKKKRTSLKSVRQDLISLIDSHAVIQLKQNSAHYLLNPSLSHTKSTYDIGKFVRKFDQRYMDLNSKEILCQKELLNMAQWFFLKTFEMKIPKSSLNPQYDDYKKEVTYYKWLKKQNINEL